MANNRLYIQDTETGELFLLAKGFGNLWTPGNESKLFDWLNTGDRDRTASVCGPTKLRLVTEDSLTQEQGARSETIAFELDAKSIRAKEMLDHAGRLPFPSPPEKPSK